ncbi:MAG TPA: HemK family protein methyltransferase [Candidatus Paceibacterota bacterium]|nr:HemK family protein methyltransferase [Candidatus Paceibacterota bacterium]
MLKMLFQRCMRICMKCSRRWATLKPTMTDIPAEDIAALIRDKYEGDTHADLTADLERLAAGEPLAYVIGWIPFAGARIELDSRPLIPRAETECWTERLIRHASQKFGDEPFALLDLCAGSGAIGVAIAAALPNAQVSFAELGEAHLATIQKNLDENGIAPSRVAVRAGDLFAPFPDIRFDFIAANPPYIPAARTLDASVTDYEDSAALFSGEDGLDLIRRIATDAPGHLRQGAELWMECDIANVEEAVRLVEAGGASRADIRTDQYGRPRYLVGYYA